ncbi:uncharacterized protein [Diadema setosum]|uniref:uncharacterized protein n=1 Tax=Diadema setosum TaxID=31175 RepID=UPI003B3A11E7
MESTGVFDKLRRIAKTVQNESALAQERMSRPASLRSSGDSARPVLRRMQADAYKLKCDSQQQLSGLNPAGEISELLEACSQLCGAYQTKVNELEDYLFQYGYKAQPCAKGPGSQGKKATAGDKCQTTTVVQPDDNQSPNLEEIKENVPNTPPKNQELATSIQEAKGGTPRLEDYGLSRATMEMLSRNKLQGLPGSRPTSALGDSGGDIPLNSTYTKREPLASVTPMRSSSQPGSCPFTPLGVTTTPARVTVTPGLFGGSELPNETPTQFIGSHKFCCDDAFLLFVFLTDMVGQRPGKPSVEVKGPATKSLQFTSSTRTASSSSSILDAFPSHLTENNAQFGTPPAPELTARWAFTSVMMTPGQPECVPRSQGDPSMPKMPAFDNQRPNVDTPPTPEMTTRWESRSNSAMPQAPERLTTQVPHVLMEEPVRLTTRLPNHTPEEPQRLTSCSSEAPPSADAAPATPPGLGRSKAFDFSRFLSDDMPKTPELTMSYSRYVDPSSKPTKLTSEPTLTAVPQKSSLSHKPVHSLESKMEVSNHVSCPTLSSVVQGEFQGQSDYMRRILPLELINHTVTRINAVLREKAMQGQGVFLTDTDVQQLDLGPKSKAMLLLLIKLQRLTTSKIPGTLEAAYYPVTV